MKKENVSILLIVILFLVVTFTTTMGWITIKNQEIKFSNLKQKELYLADEIIYLKNTLSNLNSELKNYVANLTLLEKTIELNKINQQELSMRLNGLKKELSKWEAISDTVISKIEQLDDKIAALKDNAIKSVELGEVSIEKIPLTETEKSITQ